MGIFKLHTANIYLNGSNFADVASEITLPEVKYKMATHAPSASRFSVEIPLGVEPMEIKIKGDFDPKFIAAAMDMDRVHTMQIYSDLAELDDNKGVVSQMQVTANLRVMFKGAGKLDTFKNGEAAGVELDAAVHSYKLEIEGAVIFDLVPHSNKHEVLGANINATNSQIIAR